MMNEVLRQDEAVLPAQNELNSPHFDASAIAAAQPVQALRSRRTFVWPRAPHKMIAIAIATVLSAGLALWITAGVAGQDNPASATSTMETQPQIDAPAANDQSARVRRAEPQLRRPTIRNSNPDARKPVARKVGEFKY